MVEMLHSSSGRFHLNSHRRFLPWIRSYLVALLTGLWVIGFESIFIWQTTSITGSRIAGGLPMMCYAPIPMLRPVAFNLTEFGGVGDGVTANTAAFERAVEEIARLGGGQLNVQPGVWLTAPFNLTSHMTLFLAEGAVIRGVQDEKCWLLMPPLPASKKGGGFWLAENERKKKKKKEEEIGFSKLGGIFLVGPNPYEPDPNLTQTNSNLVEPDRTSLGLLIRTCVSLEMWARVEGSGDNSYAL